MMLMATLAPSETVIFVCTLIPAAVPAVQTLVGSISISPMMTFQKLRESDCYAQKKNKHIILFV
mgnify:CR=1 FL=1